MMICALLVFMNMFETPQQSIRHYNKKRAKNTKALTIKSQMRYVKFFYGFLNHKIADGKPLERHQSFFELSLRKHNFLSFNRVFEDMRSEALDMHSFCLGPFPNKVEKFDVKISSLQKAKIEKIMVFDETSLEKFMEWHEI